MFDWYIDGIWKSIVQEVKRTGYRPENLSKFYDACVFEFEEDKIHVRDTKFAFGWAFNFNELGYTSLTREQGYILMDALACSGAWKDATPNFGSEIIPRIIPNKEFWMETIEEMVDTYCKEKGIKPLIRL